MFGSAYKIACITCTNVAIVRTQLNIVSMLIRMSQTRVGAQKHLIDRHGFDACEDDTILLTICWACEQHRSQAYELPLLSGQPGNVGHARLANPYISRNLVESWPLLQRLARGSEPSRLGTNDEARPIFKIELLSRVLEWGLDPVKFEIREILCFADVTRANSTAGNPPNVNKEQFLSPAS